MNGQSDNLIWIACGQTANHSEELAKSEIVSWFARQDSSEPWTILSNLMISYNPAETADEIDIVAIGPRGVIAVEIKHWDTAYLASHPAIVEAETKKLEKKVRRLAGKLRRAVPDLWIPGRILLTKATRGAVSPVQGIPIYSLKEISGLFDMKSSRNLITSAQREAMVRLLEPLAEPIMNGKLRPFHGFEELELLTPVSERFHREYKGIQTKTRQRIILHWYDLSAANHKKPEELARREYLSYQLLQKEAFVPRIIDSFQQAPEYPGEVYFFTISDPMAPSLEERSKDSGWSRSHRLFFARECFIALGRMHQQPTDQTLGPIFHRGLSPSNILVGYDNRPIFTRFRWAKISEAETIAQGHVPKSESLHHFMAPEVLAQGLSVADGLSDIYAMCESLKAAIVDIPEAMAVLEVGTARDPSDRKDLTWLIDQFSDLVAQSPEKPSSVLPQYWSEGTEISNDGRQKDTVYRVMQRLGAGGTGQSFKVVEINRKSGEEFGLYVAKTVNDADDAAEVLDAYRRIRPFLHDGTAKIYEIASEWAADKPMAILQWVVGDPLKSYSGVLSLYADELNRSLEELVLSWIQTICVALAPIHRQGYVHGDISPGNIIVEGSSVTLTDYDAVTPVGRILRRYNPQFASPQVRNGQPVQLSDDIFSLAATFAQVITDTDPFLWESTRQPEHGINFARFSLSPNGRLVQFLARATDPNPQARFSDAQDALHFIDNDANKPTSLSVPLSPQVATRLTEILASYPGSRYGNSETRGLDTGFAEETYVETLLDQNIYYDIVHGKVNLLILLGNAGDGKTALLQHLLKKLVDRSPPSSQRIVKDRLTDGRALYVNLDGSASYNGRSSQELLDEFFQPFMGREMPSDRIHILAINSGPLKQWLVSAGETYLTGVLTETLLGRKTGDEHIRLVDLNDRSLVGHVDDGHLVGDFVDKIFDRVLTGSAGQDPWHVCTICTANTRCGVAQSVNILRDQRLGPRVRERFGQLLQMVHQRGEIHITARELRAAMSFGFFGIQSCQDRHENSELPEQPFWERIFDVAAEGRQGDLLKEMAWLDPALTVQPALDRALLRQGNGETLENLRRKAFFFEEDPARVPLMYKGAYYRQFALLAVASEEESRSILSDLLEGLSRLGNLPEKALASTEGLCLRIPARAETESVFWVEKPKECFSLRIPSASRYLPWLPTQVELVYRNARGTDSLVLGYELFAFLMAAKDGAQFSSDMRSSDISARLSIFTQRLAEEDRRTMWAWSPVDSDAIYRIDVDGSVRVLKERN